MQTHKERPMLKVCQPEHAPANITCQYRTNSGVEPNSVQENVAGAMKEVNDTHMEKSMWGIGK